MTAHYSASKGNMRLSWQNNARARRAETSNAVSVFSLWKCILLQMQWHARCWSECGIDFSHEDRCRWHQKCLMLVPMPASCFALCKKTPCWGPNHPAAAADSSGSRVAGSLSHAVAGSGTATMQHQRPVIFEQSLPDCHGAG